MVERKVCVGMEKTIFAAKGGAKAVLATIQVTLNFTKVAVGVT